MAALASTTDSVDLDIETRELFARIGPRIADVSTPEIRPSSRGTESYFRTGIPADLLTAWLPALHAVLPKLEAGASVAEVQCGRGANSVLLAQAFGKSQFRGFDADHDCVAAARQTAAEAGVSHRTTFAVAEPDRFPVPEGGFDLIMMIDGLSFSHTAAAMLQHARLAMRAGGTLLVAEPHDAAGRLQEMLAAAGFQSVRIAAKAAGHVIVEAR